MRLTVSMGTPLLMARTAKLCLAQCIVEMIQAAPFISMMSDRRSSRMSINDKPVNAENTKMSRAKDRDSLLKR